MTDHIHILTWQDGEPATSPDAMMPLAIVEAALAPFITSRRGTDRREIEIEAVFDSSRGGDRIEYGLTLHDDDPSRVQTISIFSWSDHPGFSNVIHAALASANAWLMLGSGTRPIIAREATIPHLSQDILETFGTPHLARTPEDLFTGGEKDTPDTPPSTEPHHPDQITYWRQLQVVRLSREAVHGMLEDYVSSLAIVLKQATIEGEVPDALAQLRTCLDLAREAAAATRDVEAPDWQERARAACEALSAFGLAARAASGRIATRFSKHLHGVSHSEIHAARHLDNAEREEQKAREYRAGLVARGFDIATPPPKREPEPHELDDRALISACREQAHGLKWRRGDVWREVKDMTDQFDRPHWEWDVCSDPEALAFRGLLEALRKAARDEAAPDWIGRVSAALNDAVAFDSRSRMVARASIAWPETTMMGMGSHLASWLPDKIEAAAKAEARQLALFAELERRGLPPPEPKAKKRKTARERSR